MSPSKARPRCAQLCRLQLGGQEVQTVFHVGELPLERAQRFVNLLHSVFGALLEYLALSFCTHGAPSGSLDVAQM
jgi:hypothetical protein